MTLLKAANSRSSATRSYEFTQPVRPAAVEVKSQPIEAKAAIGTSPVQDSSLAKEGHFLEQIAALEKALSEKETEIKAAKEAAYEEGVKAGEKAAASKSDEALELLKASLSTGVKTLKEDVEDQVDISIDLARAILRRILGQERDLPAHVKSTAQRWKAELVSGTVLRVRVAADDFGDQTALDALQNELGNIEIVPQLDLKPGACLFDLRLGTLDASIDGQLAQAETFLAQTDQPAEAE